MSEVIWKSFKLGDLFTTKNGRDSSIAQKNLNKSNIKDDEHNISVITESMYNNAIGFYLKETDPIVINKIVEKGLTIGTQFGNANWHNYPHFIVGNVNYIIFKDDELFAICDDYVGNFFAKMISKIFKKSGLFGFVNKIDQNSFNREIILLPCLEVNAGDDYIWEENGKYYTLAVRYIRELMEKAKELQEQQTIRLYEAEKARYEMERETYEVGYRRERESVLWKSFKLGDLFDWSARKDLALKNYNSFSDYQEEYVEVVTGSKTSDNNFIAIKDLPANYPIYSDCLCLNTNGSIGYCMYYERSIISPTSSVHVLIHKIDELHKLMSREVNGFFSSVITKIFTGGIYNRTACLISEEKFNREIILLPCLEVNAGDDYIWEENGKYYTLAVEYISYIYLTGRVNYYQNIIDDYAYQY